MRQNQNANATIVHDTKTDEVFQPFVTLLHVTDSGGSRVLKNGGRISVFEPAPPAESWAELM